MPNHSTFVYVILAGFPGLPSFYHPTVSTLMFLVYVASLCCNGMVIVLILCKENLHKPMYVTIAVLAVSNLLQDTITLPKIIARYWFEAAAMSFAGCIFQHYCVHQLASLDACILMLMAIDRYVAICKPLQYPSVVSNRRMGHACALCVFISSMFPIYSLVTTSQIFFCGRFTIVGCFCTTSALSLLSCDDMTALIQISFVQAMVILLVPLTIIIGSYGSIIGTIQASKHLRSGQKAYYTCITHLLIIALYYVPRVFLYIAKLIGLVLNADVNVLLLCLYTFVPHVANPIIYCLMTKEIKQTLAVILSRHFRASDSLDGPLVD